MNSGGVQLCNTFKSQKKGCTNEGQIMFAGLDV